MALAQGSTQQALCLLGAVCCNWSPAGGAVRQGAAPCMSGGATAATAQRSSSTCSRRRSRRPLHRRTKQAGEFFLRKQEAKKQRQGGIDFMAPGGLNNTWLAMAFAACDVQRKRKLHCCSVQCGAAAISLPCWMWVTAACCIQRAHHVQLLSRHTDATGLWV